MPIVFFSKRLIFASMIITANGVIWVQVNIICQLALLSTGLTLWFKPYKSRKANILEAFNDCTLLSLTYFMWCFTDMGPNVETQHELGYIFIGVTMANIAVHLTVMLVENTILIKNKFKWR